MGVVSFFQGIPKSYTWPVAIHCLPVNCRFLTWVCHRPLQCFLCSLLYVTTEFCLVWVGSCILMHRHRDGHVSFCWLPTLVTCWSQLLFWQCHYASCVSGAVWRLCLDGCSNPHLRSILALPQRGGEEDQLGKFETFSDQSPCLCQAAFQKYHLLTDFEMVETESLNQSFDCNNSHSG